MATLPHPIGAAFCVFCQMQERFRSARSRGILGRSWMDASAIAFCAVCGRAECHEGNRTPA
jgi:hypothetical protein